MIYIIICIQYFIVLSMNSHFISEKFLSLKGTLLSLVFGVIFGYVFGYIGIYIQFLVFFSVLILNYYLKKTWNKNLLYASLSCSLIVLFDHIASFILLYGQNEIIKEVEIGSQMLFLLRVFFYFMFAGITIYGIKKIQKRVHLDDVGTWLVTSLSLGLYIILCTIIFFANAEGNLLSTVLLNSFFITLYFTFTVVLLFITYFYMKKRSEDKYKEKEKQNLKEYTTYLESNYNELRKFRHDYQNILTSLESFIEEDDFDRLKDYYYQSIKKTQQLMQKNDFKLSEISRLEVTEIKSIVISKLLQSQWAGIDTELEVKDRINDVNMDSVSLIRCLGIILDNAIEETKENKEGFIRMAIIKEMESISFIVQNTIKTGHPKLFEMNRSGFSTKGENRGLGLSNLKEMIDPQMNVTLETLIDNDCFIQKIEITN